MRKWFSLFFFSLSLPLFSAQENWVTLKETVYNRAQTSCWLGENALVVGRYDGTLTIFEKNESMTLRSVLATPSGNGIEMLYPIDHCTFLSSNDEESLALWREENGAYQLDQVLSYPQESGMANCAISLEVGGVNYLITGHENGYIILWAYSENNFRWTITKSIRSANPLPNQLFNIRALAHWEEDRIVSGAEDGDLCLISVPQLRILARKKYNPTAKRGINTLAIKENLLVCGNCPYEFDEDNYWLFALKNQTIDPIASANLTSSFQKKSTYLFSTLLTKSKTGETIFFASTGEGLIWYGFVSSTGIHPLGNIEATPGDGAPSLSFEQDTESLSAVTHPILLYQCALP